MDLPYSQQHLARRKQRSAANLQHLSLAPLTTRLPLLEPPVFDVSDYSLRASTTSYLQGRSAPTTPRLLSTSPPLLSRTSSRSHSRNKAGGKNGRKKGTRNLGDRAALPKSRSTTHLLGSRRHLLRRSQHRDDGQSDEEGEENGETTDDWLLRAGALVTSETRESKGQSWLTARASSTNLTTPRGFTGTGDNSPALERERLQRKAGGRAAGASNSVYASRRGSAEEQLQFLQHQQELLAANGFSSHAGSLAGSRRHSRTGSRIHSRVGSQMQLYVPKESRVSMDSGGRFNGDEYGGAPGCFDDCVEEDDDGAGYDDGDEDVPDFVNLDEKLEALQLQADTSLEDEDQIRRLVRREKTSGVMGAWVGSLFGWPLFSVQGGDDEDEDDQDEESENEEGLADEEEEEEGDADEGGNAEGSGKGGEAAGRRVCRGSRRNRRVRQRARPYFDGINVPLEEPVPPPPEADEGTWKDAAWLLSVASKVLF